MQKAFVGLAKMGVVVSLLVIFGTLITYMIPVFGADFNSTVEDNTVEAGAANVQLNFTINNTDASKNITEVNITVPSAFTYIEDSNLTSADNISFSNSTSGITNLTWINTTNNGFVENGTVEYFLFNVSVPTLLDNYTFIISTVDNDSVFNYTLLNITVVDTTPPENITLVSPTLSNNSRTPHNWTYVNATFDEIHPSNCTLEFNQTYNYSMTRNGIYCYYNVTELNDGQHSYTIYVNDTSNNSGSNGTFYITVDTTPPQITIDLPQNTTYYTGAIDYNITLDENLTNALVSIDGGANFTMTNDTGTHFYNLSGNHPNLTEGYHNATFWANDTVGNLNTSHVNFTVIIPITAELFLNVTYLNSTDHAVGLNDTIRIYVEDNDTVSNNMSANDTVEVIITSSECSITLTLNESDVHTGNFSLLTDGTDAWFNFSTGGCSNTTRTLQVNTSMHNNISLSYTDPRNGTGDAAVPITNTTMVDILVPQVVSVASTDADTIYAPGDTVNINLTIDQAGGNI